MRILHLDGESDCRDLFAALIRRPGIELDGVGACGEAVRRLAKHGAAHYDWIVADYALPDGCSLTIFSVVRFPIRRVLMTAADVSDRALRRHTREFGVETLFQKPEGVAMAAAFLMNVFENRPRASAGGHRPAADSISSRS